MRAAAPTLRSVTEAELEELLDSRELVIIRGDETIASVPRVGMIIITRTPEFTSIEAVAISGPGVEKRRARLEAIIREAGFGYAIDERNRRAAQGAA